MRMNRVRGVSVNGLPLDFFFFFFVCGKGLIGWKASAYSIRSQLCEYQSKEPGQSPSHLFHRRQAEGWWVSQGATGNLGASALVGPNPRGNGGRKASFLLRSICPSNAAVFWVPYLAATRSGWWESTRGVCRRCFLAGLCQSARVLLNFWRGGEVLAAGLSPGGACQRLCSSCPSGSSYE